MCVKTVYDLYILGEQVHAPHESLSEDSRRLGTPAWPSSAIPGICWSVKADGPAAALGSPTRE